MRHPTPEADLFRWWRAALADPRTPRTEGDPQCGYFTRRYYRGGPLQPVRIYMHQETDPETGELTADEVLMAEENGWPKNPWAIWTQVRPVTLEQYEALTDRHRTDDRMAASHTAYDVSETPMRPGG